MLHNGSDIDISKLSFAELQDLARATQKEIDRKRDEELKVLADGYAKKLAMNGFSIAEGIEALRPYAAMRAKTASPTSGSGRAAKYRNPADHSQTWVGAGKPPKWYSEQLASGKTRDSMLIP